MTKIAVTQRVVLEEQTGETRDCLDQRLSLMLLSLGFVPMPVPNSLSANTLSVDRWLDATCPDGIILSGGGDVGVESEKSRDEVERALIAQAVRDRTPLLGICRGMQQIGITFGGTLKTVSNHVSCHHPLMGDYSHSVNSYHRYALSKCPDGFRVVAESPDGVIEAIAHRHLPILGVMWHPERADPLNREDDNAINRLFGA
jgi:putative glutamine amidotransferase